MQAEAGDLDSQPCLQLLAALLSGPGVEGLRALALGRCLHSALALSPIASDLFMRATSDAGVQRFQQALRLESLPEIRAALYAHTMRTPGHCLTRPGIAWPMS